ncbi:uncharacterized protein EHS24_000435 [Apiotrichum porosum]|uniref:BTB domain-containing protein n=1 Tax=Apiotrichum porosum TaxID=105984 RepID=A0A427YA07_9TREE|nr:uncharacterized protein EHS24_000435 [Apiotrichum porosum]RSH87916.1 hypothetical protein EHS24_000435 [Apiotrichum porosum]
MSSLNLDPDFNTTGLPIFEAADGVCFSFPWEPLVAVSSFFQDLQSLPVPAGGSQGHSDSELVIPLPAATSQALKVAFHAINSVATGEPLGMTPPTDPQVLIDLITLVDAYDLDPVAVLKPISSCANILEDAGRRFALAALRQDEDEMESCSQHLLKTPEKQMSEWLNAILSAKAPAAHYRLSQLYKQREDKIHAFRSEATGAVTSLALSTRLSVTCPSSHWPSKKSMNWKLLYANAMEKGLMVSSLVICPPSRALPAICG